MKINYFRKKSALLSRSLRWLAVLCMCGCAQQSFAAGADSVENDIHLTTDGELFILHDDYLSRLLMVEDTECESLTLDELRALTFK